MIEVSLPAGSWMASTFEFRVLRRRAIIENE